MTQQKETWESLGGKIHKILNETLWRKLTIREHKRLVKLVASVFTMGQQAEQRGADRAEKKYADIFSWLQGTNGEFPDLSQKPHYSFRAELRSRLEKARTSSDKEI